MNFSQTKRKRRGSGMQRREASVEIPSAANTSTPVRIGSITSNRVLDRAYVCLIHKVPVIAVQTSVRITPRIT